MDKIIKIPPEAADKLAMRAVRRIDYDAIVEKVKAMIPTPKDGKDLVMTEALRADVIDSAAKLVPAGKPGEPGKDGRDGSDYILTQADRETIAAKVRADMDNPSIEEIVNRVVNELDQQGFLVSSSVFQARMDAVRADVRKKILNAGISGKDMTEEINKFLGSNELQARRSIGHIDGFVVKYSAATAVTITSGSIEANGRNYALAADATHDMTSLATGFDFHYIYIDDDASSAPAAVFIDSTTEPAWSDSKRGWYNGDDRMIGVAASIAGASELLCFDAVAFSGNHIRITHCNFLNDLKLAESQNPDGNWQTPNVAESDVYTPVNAVEAKIAVQNGDVGSSVRVAWASNEVAAIFTSILQAAESMPGFTSAKVSAWAALGASRKVKVGGNADDDNNLAAGVAGYGYSR